MAKGSIAKNVVTDIIKQAFGKNYLGIKDNKIYVCAEELGENVQIAIGLTCPKNPVSFIDSSDNGDWNFTAATPVQESNPQSDLLTKIMTALEIID